MCHANHQAYRSWWEPRYSEPFYIGRFTAHACGKPKPNGLRSHSPPVTNRGYIHGYKMHRHLLAVLIHVPDVLPYPICRNPSMITSGARLFSGIRVDPCSSQRDDWPVHIPVFSGCSSGPQPRFTMHTILDMTLACFAL